ncbi:S8 family serine peptidase [Streptomyces sp. NPDC048337]|uniref:S8 family serine peptidase n=1 Tax=Streptomyces sp. NPDC048337 TaxID=3365535 RepID=UPI0037245525
MLLALTALTLGAAPSYAEDGLDGTQITSPVDPPLYDEVVDGGKVRVNVVTENRSQLDQAATAGETLQTLSTLPVVTLRVDEAGLEALASQEGVVSVTEDVPVPPSLDESTALIKADKATAGGYDGSGQAVAILDTGVAVNHPFLKDRVIAEACFSSNDSAYGATSLCPNGTTAQEGPGTADVEATGCATIAGCDHGTHVAGIVAGNGKDITGAPKQGVAPGAGIVAMQVFSKFTSSAYCGATAPCVLSFTSSQLAAMEKVLALKQGGMPIAAANLSLGSGRYTSACNADPRKKVIDDLFAAGVATVVAAGNSGYTNAVSAPACVPSAVAVGSTTDADQLSSFSNRGPLLDVFAPGTGIVSSVPGGQFASKNGTSMASPHVAAAIAVLRQAHGEESLDNLLTLLKSKGKPVTYTGATTPRIDLAATFETGEPEPAPAPKPHQADFANTNAAAIPDVGTVTSQVQVSGMGARASGALQVWVDLTHQRRNDLRIDLVDPAGTAHRLSLGYQGAGDVKRFYGVDASAAPADGTWTLKVQDVTAGNTGTLRNWSIGFPVLENQTVTAIPDGGSVELPVTGPDLVGYPASEVNVYVDLTHEWRGDVRLDLIAPDGTEYFVKSPEVAQRGGDLQRLYPVTIDPEQLNGTWKLRVSDVVTGSTGTLKSWALVF